MSRKERMMETFRNLTERFHDLMNDAGELADEHVPTYSRAHVKELFDKLYEDIKHGDSDHQRWLRDKIHNFTQTI
jgi:hypothetical protein